LRSASARALAAAACSAAGFDILRTSSDNISPHALNPFNAAPPFFLPPMQPQLVSHLGEEAAVVPPRPSSFNKVRIDRPEAPRG
jgi:hypothetical protein